MSGLIPGRSRSGSFGSSSAITSPQTSSSSSQKETIYSYTFNQDASCISVGTSKGYSIFNVHPFKPWLHESIGGVAIVEMLYCTSLLALVGAGDQEGFSPRCLKIWNTKRKASLFDMGFVSKILAVKMNRKRLVVGLAKSLYIFDLETMQKVQDMDTAHNPKGLLALSPREEPSFLAYPGEAEKEDQGIVLLHDVVSLRLVNKIHAHTHKLAAMSFSLDGSLLATASEQGTVIRVFSVPAGERLYTLRRGRSPSTIHSLAFNHAASRLAVSSDKGTIHVFSLSSSSSSSSSTSITTTDTSSFSSSPSPTTHKMDLSSSSSPLSPPTTTPTHTHTSTSATKKLTQFLTAATSPSSSNSTYTHTHTHTHTQPASSSLLVSSVLPKRFSDTMEGTRSFAQARLKETPTHTHTHTHTQTKKIICALVPSRGHTHTHTHTHTQEEESESLVVLTGEGHFYRFKVNLREGGVCVCVEEKTLLQEEVAAQALSARVL